MLWNRMFQIMLRFKQDASLFGYRVDPKLSPMLAYPSMINCRKHKRKLR